MIKTNLIHDNKNIEDIINKTKEISKKDEIEAWEYLKRRIASSVSLKDLNRIKEVLLN